MRLVASRRLYVMLPRASRHPAIRMVAKLQAAVRQTRTAGITGQSDLRLWYRQPAANWNEALPDRQRAARRDGVRRRRQRAAPAQRRHGLGGREAGPAESRGPRGGSGDPPAAASPARPSRPRRSPTRPSSPCRGACRRTSPWAICAHRFHRYGGRHRLPAPAGPRRRHDARELCRRRNHLYARGVLVSRRSGDRRPPDEGRARNDRLHREAVARAGRDRHVRTARTGS